VPIIIGVKMNLKLKSGNWLLVGNIINKIEREKENMRSNTIKETENKESKQTRIIEKLQMVLKVA